MPYALVLLSFPLIYYITSPEVYYRRPIDPMCVVLAVFAVTGARKLKSIASPVTESGVPPVATP
jgi:hypothetical protein